MIEIQCKSCHTRYRIDESVLPDDEPTFKCSRCGHVFTTEPIAKTSSAAAPRPQRPFVRDSGPSKPERERPRQDKPQQDHFHDQSDDPDARLVIKKPAAPPEDESNEPTAEPPGAFTAEAWSAAASEKAPTPGESASAGPRRSLFGPKFALKKSSSGEQPTHPAGIDESARPAHRPQTPDPTTAVNEERVRPVFAEKSPQKSPQDDIFNRPIQDPDSGALDGDNLAFDFREEVPQGRQEKRARQERTFGGDDRWEVGNEDFDQHRLPERKPYEQPPTIADRMRPPHAAPLAAPASFPAPEPESYAERAELHSAGYFMVLFFLVAAGFAAIAVAVCAIPSASAAIMRNLPVIGPVFKPPVPLESMVGLEQVESKYVTVKDGHPALVVSGTARNTSAVPLHAVQLGVKLQDTAGKEIAGGAVYTGNTLAPKMIPEMTPHELQFLQKLDPQKGFVMEPAHTSPFVIVFVDPPSGISNYSVSVFRADPAPPAAPAPRPEP